MTAGTTKVEAGDDGWATVGKVLTGVVIASAVHQTTHHGGHVSAVLGAPPPRAIVAPQPVFFPQPRVVVAPCPRLRPAPVVVYRPVYGHRPVVVGRPVYAPCVQPVHVMKKQHKSRAKGHGRRHGQKRRR